MNDFAGKHIVLGLSGGIACYKAAELCRALIKEGATVQVVMTEAAEQFITPVTMQALSGRPVYSSQWDAASRTTCRTSTCRARPTPSSSRRAAPISWPSWCTGGADELLSLMCLARPIDQVPLLLAPAMNREMWAHPATQRNMMQLAADGAHILGVGNGFQACGETGDGRMLEPPELLEDIIAFFQPKLLAGKQVLVTAGPTFEAIDPVRGITNHSSGKMGFAIARAAREAGAEVTLVAGPVSLPTPRGVQRIDVQSAQRHARRPRSRRPSIGRRLHRHGRGGRLAPGAAHSGRRSRKTASGKPPELAFTENPDILADRGAIAARQGGRAVLRRLRRREPEPRGQRPGQARAQGHSAAGRQHRPGDLRRTTTTRCCWSTNSGVREMPRASKLDTGARAGGRDRARLAGSRER